MYHLVPDVRRCTTDVSYCPVAAPIPQWNLTRCLPTCDWYAHIQSYEWA